jgi:hypothetical protein
VVTVDEIVTLVNVALGTEPVAACPAGDLNRDALISVNEILSALRAVLNGCAAG